MKNGRINKIGKNLARLGAVMLGVVLLASCHRRELDEMGTTTAVVTMKLDWSASKLDLSDVKAFSAWFFPKTGGEPIYTVSNNLTGTEIQLPVGVYDVLVFNESIISTDWKSLAFRGTDKFETFEAYVRTDMTAARGLYEKAANEVVINSIEPMAVFRLRDFEVTEAMVVDTRKKTKSGTDTRSVIDLKLLPLTYEVGVTAKIKNMNNAYVISSVLKNMASSVFLGTGKQGATPVSQQFMVENFKWDQGSNKNGEASAKVFSFGRADNTALKNDIQFDILTFTGTQQNPFVFDVTQEFLQGNQNFEINLSIGFPPNEEETIVLPEFTGNNNVEIGDWNKEGVDVK